MVLAIVVLIVGFVLLVKGADFFVEGAAAVALKFSIPTFIIGLTVVAMGTSAPECAVSIVASMNGNNGMAISNVIGSNIFNLMVVLGISAFFAPLHIEKKTLRREFPMSIAAAVLLMILGGIGMIMGHVDGIILVVLFAAFIIWMVMEALRSIRSGEPMEEDEIQALSMGKSIIFIIGGIAAIVIGGEIVVKSASFIAAALGMSDTLIGLTVCSVGTSLPELVTSVVAAKKNETDMAIGNVIGSNIFNILLVGGIASAISPIAITMNNIIDIGILVVFSIIVLALVWRRQKLRKAGGAVIVVLYVIYLAYIIVRDMQLLPFFAV